jgi:hypothetical protein
MKKIYLIKNILIETERNRILESPWQNLEDPQGKRAGG